MATTQYEGVLSYVDTNGNVTEMYPNIKTDTSLSVSGKAADAATVGTKITTLTKSVSDNKTLMTELKKSVSDGKTLVANAITDKGVETATDSTFIVMANNIANIVVKDDTTYQSQLYNSLKNSGFVTEDMTFDEMCTVLANKYPLQSILVDGPNGVNKLGSFGASGYLDNTSQYVTFNSNGLCFYAYGNDGDNSQARYSCGTAVDLTNFNKLIITISYNSIYVHRDRNWQYFGIRRSHAYDDSFVKSVNAKSNGTYTLDISGLSGYYYFGGSLVGCYGEFRVSLIKLTN